MRRFPRYCLLAHALLALTVLAVSVAQRRGNRAAALQSIDEWDFPQLVEHLNRTGLEVQLQSPRKDGLLVHNAYLTTTSKDWEALNYLVKDPSRIESWQGVVHCERVGRERQPLFHSWDDPCLATGPFVFFGDADLLERIGSTLAPSAKSDP